MMKPAPASSFVMAESEFLLQFLVIPSMIQRCLAIATRSFNFIPAGSVESQYLAGSVSLSATQSGAILPRVVRPASSRGAPDELAARQNGSGVGVACLAAMSPPSTTLPARKAPVLSPELADGLYPAQQARAAHPFSRQWRQWFRARRPHRKRDCTPTAYSIPSSVMPDRNRPSIP